MTNDSSFREEFEAVAEKTEWVGGVGKVASADILCEYLLCCDTLPQLLPGLARMEWTN